MKLQVDWEGNNILLDGKRVWMTNLFYDNKENEAHYYFGNGKSDKMLDLQIKDFVDAAEIPYKEKPQKVILHIYNEEELKIYGFSIYFDVGEQERIRLQLRPKLTTWRDNFTYKEFFEVFIKELKQSDLGWFFDNQEENEFLFVVKKIDSLNSCVRLEINTVLKELDLCINNSLIFLNLNLVQTRFSASFNFPDNLKTPCEQYLLYFAQFLQDLGINATSNLKEEAGKVLFSITPTDDVDALDKIREALAVYLNLPASPIVYEESFAAMRLQQQVENLQHSQKMAVREIRSAERELRLAQTVIEHQDKIIVQKDSIIEQQNKVIEKIQSKSIMMDSLENKEELEELYDGLKIGESKFLKEQLGIHLNPTKIIKTAVKNTFGKEDKGESILGLDEE